MATYKSKAGVVLRANSGTLTAAETVLPILGLEGFNRAVVQINQTANLICAAGEQVDFSVETSYDAAAGIYRDSATNTAETVELGETVITVVSGAVFEVGDVIRMDAEKMLITAIATNDITVTRAYENTAEATHGTALDIFFLIATWIELGQVHYENGDDASAPHAVLVLGIEPLLAAAILQDLPTTLGDDTVRALPLGDRIRIRTVITNTPSYTYEAVAHFYTD